MKLEPLVKNEILNKLSKDKQIAILKTERNALLAFASIDHIPFSWVQKTAILHSACIYISEITKSKEYEQ